MFNCCQVSLVGLMVLMWGLSCSHIQWPLEWYLNSNMNLNSILLRNLVFLHHIILYEYKHYLSFIIHFFYFYFYRLKILIFKCHNMLVLIHYFSSVLLLEGNTLSWNTSLLTKMCYLAISYSLYPVWLEGYPIMIHFLPLESNLFLPYHHFGKIAISYAS